MSILSLQKLQGSRRGLSRLSLFVVFTFLLQLFAPAPVQASYGRTEGGYAGGLVGATGGAALGSALVGAAGIANPLLAGTVVVASSLGTGAAGARLGSYVGDEWIDDKFSAKNVWTVVGGLTGALAGVVLGPAGSVAGKVLGAALGAAVGGIVGRYVSDTADKDFNPRTVGGLIGGINGLMLGGPLGAVAGVTLGYLGGKVLDKHIFWSDDDKDSRRSRSRDDEDFDPREAYGEDYEDRFYDEDGDYVGGYDRQGYDRMGFDDRGFDREGFDRKGYDRDGVDRNGYDEDGFLSKPERKYARQARASADEYDPEIYNAFWSWYSHHGGTYPDFVDKHWDHFPEDASRQQRIRYVARFHRQIQDALDDGEEQISELKKEWKAAAENLRNTVREQSDSSREAREEALRRLHDLEEQLREAVRERVLDK